MLRKLALLAAISPALWLSSAAALGLGEIDVKSALNQRFAAVIPLAAVSAEEAESAQVSLASYAEFQRAGLERSDYLSSLRFTVRTDGGAPRIEVSSAQIAREPFVNFLVEVRSQGNRLLREYTVLLDPPGFQPAPSAPVVATAPARPATVAPAPAAAPAPKPAAAAPKPATPEFFETSEESAARPSAPAQQAPAASVPAGELPTPAGSGGDSYGPVKAGETFWSIASRLRDPSATMPQMLLAIYEANRGAFDGGINGLRIGSSLQIPSLDQITAVPPATAKARVDALRAGPAAVKPKPAVVAPATPATAPPAVKAPEPVAAPTPTPKPEIVAAPPAPAPALPLAEPAAPAEPVAVPPPAESAAPVDQSGAPAAQAGEVPPSEQATEVPVADAVEEQPAAEIPVEETVAASEPEAEGGLVELLIPLFGLLLVIGGGGYLASNLLKKRKEAKASKQGFSPPPSAPRSSPGKPAAAAAAAVAAKPTVAELQRLDDTLNDATESFDTQQLQTQQIPALAQQPEIRRVENGAESTSQLPTFDSTQNFNAPPKKTMESGDVDFDLTGQFAAETVQINLDANDPVAEADFHLAYGLYDEAILLLKQAALKDPGRSELGVKLAETYFAAGRPMEFQETAESLLGRIDEGSWQKIAIMGQQLCPDAEVFKGAELGGMSTDVDLMFDEPTAAPVTALPELPDVAMAPQPQDHGLDFRLEELELPKLDTTVKADLPELKDDHALEFDLGDFDLSNTRSPDKPAQPQGNEVAFDLGGADSAGFEDLAGTLPGKPLQASETSVQLDDFDLGDLGSDSDSISAGDETSTKLDLARAYVDMGDNEMARSLLSEVLTQGSDAQKHEAQNLLGRLS